ncbi:MAG: hypothetical protein ACFUZC_14225 [Chthoniobacteraceae bacterium]
MKIVSPHSSQRLILGAIISLSLALGARAEVVYSTDFESPAYTAGQAIGTTSVNGWVGNHNGSSLLVQITDETSHGGKQCLMEMDQDPSDGPGAWHRFQGRTLENAEITFYLKLVSEDTAFRVDFADEGHGVTFMIGHGYHPDLGGAGWWVKPDKGNIISGVADKAVSYNPTAWNKLSFKYNKAENTVALALNDKEILALSKAQTEGLILQGNRFRFVTGWVAGSGANLKAYVDDLVISTNP